MPWHDTTAQRGIHSKDQSIFQPVKNSVSVIINKYKSLVKRWCNKNGFDHFQWQSRFYDQILQNINSIDTIKEYICNNPKNGLVTIYIINIQ
jgi:beta-mannanase